MDYSRYSLVVSLFTKSECNPCEEIKPKFNELENKYGNVNFSQVELY